LRNFVPVPFLPSPEFVAPAFLDAPIGAPIQPHASAWGYFHARNTPKLTHGADRGTAILDSVVARRVSREAAEQS